MTPEAGMQHAPIQRIVIVGGGTAGWMAAASLSRVLPAGTTIRLIESEEIATVGVGEATIPTIKQLNETLGIDEADFIRRTQGTFKLGIEFVNWRQQGDRYIHGFGKIGQDKGLLPFYQYWLKLHLEGRAADLGEYSINTVAPRFAKFMPARQDLQNSPLADITYAYHFDAGLYARYLRELAESHGVMRIEGKIKQVCLRPSDGFIESVVLESEQVVPGELFIDCSGFRGLLIEEALRTGFEDWSHWLPCDRAIAVQTQSAGKLLPCTRSTAHAAGWQWRIPLQHRTGNGHVFCSQYMSEDEACAVLMKNLDAPALNEPRTLSFKAGKRCKVWNRNCVAVGLASGFLEPLESTSIHLIQSVIARLVAHFPDSSFSSVLIDEFNRQADFEYERIRDFIILHYHANQRDDAPLWRNVRQMEIPASLRRKMDLFRHSGRIFRENEELFSEVSWLQVMHGQGWEAQACSPIASEQTAGELVAFTEQVRHVIARCVELMPEHENFIQTFITT
jgi:tryptophan halogenase